MLLTENTILAVYRSNGKGKAPTRLEEYTVLSEGIIVQSLEFNGVGEYIFSVENEEWTEHPSISVRWHGGRYGIRASEVAEVIVDTLERKLMVEGVAV